jgi:aspartate/glutamate racemase
MKDLSNRKIGVIHAALISSKAVQPFIEDVIPEVKVLHHVEDTIQESNFASQPGVIPKANFLKFANAAYKLQEAGAELVMLACSTFNKAVENARPMIDVPLLQIDRPMMDLAVNAGSKIGLLATVPTTVPASERLLRQAAEDAGRSIEVNTTLSEKAFEAILKGDAESHNRILMEEIQAMSKENDAIVLAQVSMSALEPELNKANLSVPVYNSGRTAFEEVRRVLENL